MEGWGAGGLHPHDADMAEVLLQLRTLSDDAKALAVKWNKEYTAAWRQAEHLKNSDHRCGGEQGCPLINARCAAASANLRYKSALHIAMSLMSFTVQGQQGLRANLGQVQQALQELVSGGVPGGDWFMAECRDQVQQVWARIQGLGGSAGPVLPLPVAVASHEVEGGKGSKKRGFDDAANPLEGDCWSFQHHDKSARHEVEGGQASRKRGFDDAANPLGGECWSLSARHEVEGGQGSRKRGFDDAAYPLEGECWSFQHNDKRRKQR